MRRFFRLLRLALFGPEQTLAYRMLKHDYWLSGHYVFNPDSPTTSYTQTVFNRPFRTTDVPNPLYWPGLREQVRAELEGQTDDAQASSPKDDLAPPKAEA